MTNALTSNPACLARIDTTALRHNYASLKQQAHGAHVMAVVKANAYGHGLLTVANALPEADAFGVARLDEAIQLRKANISQRIVILGGVHLPEEWRIADAYNLDVVVHQSEQLQACQDFCSGLPEDQLCKLGIWLKFDTGMLRLGFPLSDIDLVKAALRNIEPHLQRAPVIMSHYANADEKGDPFNQTQSKAFTKLRDNFEPDNNKDQHSIYEFAFANSGALLSDDDHTLDWVRPGIALYGISPFADKRGSDFDLRPVMSLKSRLIAIKLVKKGEGVGYGQTWFAEKDMRVGVASIGYGDGYPWQAKNGTPIIVDGVRCALAGRVSMDLVSIDLSEHPNARLGSTVELWGDDLPVEQVANHAQTIPYTLVCGITQRVTVEVI